MQTYSDEPAVGEGAGAPPDIVELVELVQRLQSEERPASPDEARRRAAWTGWGAAAPAFEAYPRGHWADVGAQLRMLLVPEGAQAASAATPTSYFTPASIAGVLWQLATALGFDGGHVLEPGCGSGAILAAAPPGLALEVTGVEREPFSAAVARLRVPGAKIITASLEKVALVNGSFDLVVGNVPFSSVRVYDRETRGGFALHNYFLWRALEALRPGGLAVLLTSMYTLDAARDMQRVALGARGNLLGAIRFPSGALTSAGTEAVSDILVLQRPCPAVAWRGQPWMDVSPEVVPGVWVNEYFARCPHHLLGTPVVERGLYRGNELRVLPPDDLPAALGRAVESVVETARENGAAYVHRPDYTAIGEHLVRRRSDGRKEGSYHVLDGQLVQVLDGEPRPVTRHTSELAALAQLREMALHLLEAERDLDRPDGALAPIRERLGACYAAYVAAYGPIHRATLLYGPVEPETGEQDITRRRPPALAAFSQDPDYAVVLGLEYYDDETLQATKAPIFHRRVHVRPVRPATAASPSEALALCLDERGRLDLEVLGRLLSTEAAAVPARLGDLAYEDPRTFAWLPAPQYLSGDVRAKLEEALRAAAREPERFGRNVSALEAVLPEDLAPGEIKALLGAPWIDPADIEQFCEDLLGARPTVGYERLTATWEVGLARYVTLSAAATSEWGTRQVNAFRLVELGLNKGVPVVYDTVDGAQVRNVEETLAAQDKLATLQARFSEWVWEDDERAGRLAAEYNRLFNSVVPRAYDGAHLSFPGMDEGWAGRLYPWQRDFVWRMACSRSALCGHPVGAGKTLTEIAGAMTLRRLGLITKAAIVVPNHLLEQITAEAQRLYPGARVLMVSRDDLSRERRKLFAARVALGDYDFVVLTHAGLSALAVHPETERAYLEQRIAVYRQAMLDLDGGADRRRKRSVKRLETAIEKMRQRQARLLDRPRDDGVTFEQLGVSYLAIDEAQAYKNLGLPTNVAGLQVQPSRRPGPARAGGSQEISCGSPGGSSRAWPSPCGRTSKAPTIPRGCGSAWRRRGLAPRPRSGGN